MILIASNTLRRFHVMWGNYKRCANIYVQCEMYIFQLRFLYVLLLMTVLVTF